MVEAVSEGQPLAKKLLRFGTCRRDAEVHDAQAVVERDLGTAAGFTTDADIISMARMSWPRWKPLSCIECGAALASCFAGLAPIGALVTSASASTAASCFIAHFPRVGSGHGITRTRPWWLDRWITAFGDAFAAARAWSDLVTCLRLPRDPRGDPRRPVPRQRARMKARRSRLSFTRSSSRTYIMCPAS